MIDSFQEKYFFRSHNNERLRCNGTSKKMAEEDVAILKASDSSSERLNWISIFVFTYIHTFMYVYTYSIHISSHSIVPDFLCHIVWSAIILVRISATCVKMF